MNLREIAQMIFDKYGNSSTVSASYTITDRGEPYLEFWFHAEKKNGDSKVCKNFNTLEALENYALEYCKTDYEVKDVANRDFDKATQGI